MIMFCWSYRQLAEALWLSLYCIRCKHQIIALLYRYAIAIVARAIVGETTVWWHIDIDQDDGDHGVMPVTKMIMVPRRWRSKEHDDIGHIMSLFDCMWCLSCFASYLLSTMVVNKMIPYNNFKKVFPLTVRRCESSLFRSTTWWSGVIDSNVRIQRVLTSLACTDMASEHTQYT